MYETQNARKVYPHLSVREHVFDALPTNGLKMSELGTQSARCYIHDEVCVGLHAIDDDPCQVRSEAFPPEDASIC